MRGQEVRDVHREAALFLRRGPRLTPHRGPWGSRFCHRGTKLQRSGAASKLGEPRILDGRQPSHAIIRLIERERYSTPLTPRALFAFCRKLIVTREGRDAAGGSVELKERDRAAVPASSAGMRQPPSLLRQYLPLNHSHHNSPAPEAAVSKSSPPGDLSF